MPYLISHNVHSGQVIILNEINDLKKAQIRLLDESARQKIVYEKLSIGTWEWEIENDRLICSDDTIAMFGKQPATFNGRFDEFTQCLHPDDKKLLETNL
jgi:PAS domain-containing protein